MRTSDNPLSSHFSNSSPSRHSSPSSSHASTQRPYSSIYESNPQPHFLRVPSIPEEDEQDIPASGDTSFHNDKPHSRQPSMNYKKDKTHSNNNNFFFFGTPMTPDLPKSPVPTTVSHRRGSIEFTDDVPKFFQEKPVVSVTYSDLSESNYFSQFKSLDQQRVIVPIQHYADPDYLSLKLVQRTAKQIERIANIKREPRNKYYSRFNFSSTLDCKFVALPMLSILKHTPESQHCQAIVYDLDPQSRRSLNPSNYSSLHEHSETNRRKNLKRAPSYNFKQLSTESYIDAIIEKDSAVLLRAIISNYGTLTLDQAIRLSDLNYVVLPKKETNETSINTDKPFFSLEESVQPQSDRISALQMQIQLQKRRQPRAPDYFEAMEEKLTDLFFEATKYEAFGKMIGMDIKQKLLYTLKHIDEFKGRQVDGHSLTSVLLYFVKELKLLRDQLQLVRDSTNKYMLSRSVQRAPQHQTSSRTPRKVSGDYSAKKLTQVSQNRSGMTPPPRSGMKKTPVFSYQIKPEPSLTSRENHPGSQTKRKSGKEILIMGGESSSNSMNGKFGSLRKNNIFNKGMVERSKSRGKETASKGSRKEPLREKQKTENLWIGEY